MKSPRLAQWTCGPGLTSRAINGASGTVVSERACLGQDALFGDPASTHRGPAWAPTGKAGARNNNGLDYRLAPAMNVATI